MLDPYEPPFTPRTRFVPRYNGDEWQLEGHNGHKSEQQLIDEEREKNNDGI